jgi:hypothetical protein
VTDSRISLQLSLTAAVALAIATWTSTAHADAGAASNIPASEQDSASPLRVYAADAPNDLPLPYEPWQGAGLAPPKLATARDLPPPLARAPQSPRRPLEVTAALALFLPSCGSGSVDDRACLTVAPGSGLDLALLYRGSPFFAVGAEAILSGFRARGRGPLSSAGGGARFIGVTGRVYFADEGAWDPYVALTVGVGSLSLQTNAEADTAVSTTGFGARFAGGVDYLLGSRVRLGPSVSLSRWLAWSEEQCEASVCSPGPAIYGRVLGFATLGLRVTASFGEVL